MKMNWLYKVIKPVQDQDAIVHACRQLGTEDGVYNWEAIQEM